MKGSYRELQLKLKNHYDPPTTQILIQIMVH